MNSTRTACCRCELTSSRLATAGPVGYWPVIEWQGVRHHLAILGATLWEPLPTRRTDVDDKRTA